MNNFFQKEIETNKVVFYWKKEGDVKGADTKRKALYQEVGSVGAFDILWGSGNDARISNRFVLIEIEDRIGSVYRLYLRDLLVFIIVDLKGEVWADVYYIWVTTIVKIWIEAVLYYKVRKNLSV